MDRVKSIQWNYAIGREVVGGQGKMVIKQRGPVSVDELKCLWDKVLYNVFGFHLGSDYQNYMGLE